MSCSYVGLDVHQASICIAVVNADGKLVMESVVETSAATILDFLKGLRRQVEVTFEEGTHAAWLYDVLKRTKARVIVCDPRKNRLLLVPGRMSISSSKREMWLAKLGEAGAQARAGRLYSELDQLSALRREARKAMLVESRRHAANRILRQVPTLGPVRVAQLLARGLRPELARVTIARKIAAITLAVWKKGESFDGNKLIKQAA